MLPHMPWIARHTAWLFAWGPVGQCLEAPLLFKSCAQQHPLLQWMYSGRCPQRSIARSGRASLSVDTSGSATGRRPWQCACRTAVFRAGALDTPRICSRYPGVASLTIPSHTCRGQSLPTLGLAAIFCRGSVEVDVPLCRPTPSAEDLVIGLHACTYGRGRRSSNQAATAPYCCGAPPPAGALGRPCSNELHALRTSGLYSHGAQKRALSPERT